MTTAYPLRDKVGSFDEVSTQPSAVSIITSALTTHLCPGRALERDLAWQSVSTATTIVSVASQSGAVACELALDSRSKPVRVSIAAELTRRASVRPSEIAGAPRQSIERSGLSPRLAALPTKPDAQSDDDVCLRTELAFETVSLH